jgi:hypothetical protein
MANFVYTEACRAIMEGELDLNATDDIRVMLQMTNTTFDTEKDITTLGGIVGTDDEFDGSGYSAGGQALAGEVVNKDDANDRAEFDATNLTWSSVSAGTRQIAGFVVFKFITSYALSMPLAWIDTGGFPFTPGGGDITIQWNAEGIIQAQGG